MSRSLKKCIPADPGTILAAFIVGLIYGILRLDVSVDAAVAVSIAMFAAILFGVWIATQFTLITMNLLLLWMNHLYDRLLNLVQRIVDILSLNNGEERALPSSKPSPALMLFALCCIAIIPLGMFFAFPSILLLLVDGQVDLISGSYFWNIMWIGVGLSSFGILIQVTWLSFTTIAVIILEGKMEKLAADLVAVSEDPAVIQTGRIAVAYDKYDKRFKPFLERQGTIPVLA